MTRWRSGETRHAAFWLRDSDGAPALGLAPAVIVVDAAGAPQPPPAVAEVGHGFYAFEWTAPAEGSYLFLADAGAALPADERWVPLEVSVGGWVDDVDAPVTSRAAAADVATVLARLTEARAAALDNLDRPASSSASAEAVQAVADALTAVAAALGDPAQAPALGDVAAAVADVMPVLADITDALAARLDVAVSTRQPAGGGTVVGVLPGSTVR